jgi:hypothetical protein
VIVAYAISGVLFVIGVYLIATSRRRRSDLTERLLRHQPIEVQARRWLDRQEGQS